MTPQRLSAALGLLLSACTCAIADPDVRYACRDGGVCGPGFLCSPDNLCLLPAELDAGRDGGADAGLRDGGADAGLRDGGADAGLRDAGLDAGLRDAGLDAGVDAGPDAGVDAGEDAGVDAGCALIGGSCQDAGDCCLPLCLANTCQSPTGACPSVVELPASGSSQNSTKGTGSSSGASCSPATGGDDVYLFTTTEISTPFFAQVRPIDGGTLTSPPALYLRDSCAPSVNVPDLVCASALGVGQAAVGLSLPPGTWFLYVDSWSGSMSYDLTTSRSISGDTCASPFLIELAPTGPLSTAILASDTSPLAHNYASDCAASGSPRDAVVAVVVPRPGRLTVRLRSTWDSSVSIQRSCGLIISEISCSDLRGSGQEALSENLNSGTYFIWISGHTAGDKGPFSLELSLQ